MRSKGVSDRAIGKELDQMGRNQKRNNDESVLNLSTAVSVSESLSPETTEARDKMVRETDRRTGQDRPGWMVVGGVRVRFADLHQHPLGPVFQQRMGAAGYAVPHRMTRLTRLVSRTWAFYPGASLAALATLATAIWTHPPPDHRCKATS